MLESLNRQNTKLKWIGREPLNNKKVALIIPQFNESSNINFNRRLKYYNGLMNEFRDLLDVIVVDDGSTDDSLKRIIEYNQTTSDSFFLSTVQPNANKVGALYLTVLAINYEYVILTDFDTDIIGLNEVPKIIDLLDKEANLMGCYFRMIPFDGAGAAFLFQQLEYSLLRSFYKLHESEQSVPVMPGAGSCYKREILVAIYGRHSGLRSGEDREATILGHKLGYGTIYAKDILSLTRPPLTFKTLLKQRRRWNLGYLETIYKERKYYFSQIRQMNLIGFRTLIDGVVALSALSMPFIILVISAVNLHLLTTVLIAGYLTGVAWSLYGIGLSSDESKEFQRKRFYSILYYPIYKFVLDSMAWSSATFDFLKKRLTD